MGRRSKPERCGGTGDEEEEDDDDRDDGGARSPPAMATLRAPDLTHAQGELALVRPRRVGPPDSPDAPRGPRIPRQPGPRDPQPDPPQGVPVPPWEPYGLAQDCEIQRPPPPSGARNPGVGVFDGDLALDPPVYPAQGHPAMSGGLQLAAPARGARQDAPFPPVPPPPPPIDQILGPERPLCPPSMAFDYDWQSCWPKDVPHDPPPDGATWPHACRCPPGRSWLAVQQRCWTRGSIPGSQNQASGVLLGHGAPIHAVDDYAPAPVGWTEMPFRTEAYDVTKNEVTATLGDAPSGSHIEVVRRIGMQDVDDWEWDDYCHTQGIVHTGDFVITSCMTKHGKRGFVQFYEYLGIHNFEDDYKDGAQGGEVRNVRLLSHPHPHAVPGQMVRGIEVTSDMGVLLTWAKDVCLFPVGSEGSPRGENPSFDLRIFDQFGEEHPEMGAVLEGGYACGALFSQVIPGTEETVGLFLLVIAHDSFSLYGFPWNGATQRFAAPVPLIKEEDRDSVTIDGVKYLYKNLIKPQYQAACMFQGSDGLYLVGTHDQGRQQWMDTYKIEVAWTDQQDEEGFFLKLDKLAKVKYPNKPGTVEGLFFNGTAIQRLGPREMRFWVSPWDYQMSNCVPASEKIKCTYLWHWTTSF